MDSSLHQFIDFHYGPDGDSILQQQLADGFDPEIIDLKTDLMLRIVTFLLALIFVCSCSKKSPLFELEDGLHLSEVMIITSENGDYQPYVGHVITEGDKIIYLGVEKPDIKGNFQEINGNGKFLIPGLIDSHLHIAEVQGMVYHHLEKYPEMADAFRKQVPRSYLYFGFTSLINLGGITQEQLNFYNEQPIKPELYHTGRSGASVANGYPMNFAPEEFRFDSTPNFIYLESEADNIPDKFSPSDHTPEAVVKRIKEAGSIAVKAYYERGFHGNANLPVPTTEIMEELKTQARENGLVLTVHGNSLEAHDFLTEAGVDIIAHGLWNWEKYGDVPADSLPTEIKAILDMQIEKQIGYTPTLTVIEGERVLIDPDFLNDPRLENVVPGEMIDWYKTEEGQWFAKELFGDFPPDEVNKIYGRIQAHGQQVLKYLSDNGGLILFGTDTPSGPIYGNPPGYNGYIEFKLMHEAGVPLNKILASATINNARAFNLDSIVGFIEAGKRANMVILSKNPLQEVEAYDQIEMIILAGEILKREELSANKLEAN